MTISLSEEQIKNIREHIENFKKYSKSEEYRRDLKNRWEREEFIANALKEENIETMTEFDFGEIISKLWASQMWANKEYLVRRIVEDNGLDKIKNNLRYLLYGQDPFEIRYDQFVGNVKGLGPASITEILCFFNPEKYGIWNDKARKALKKLGFEDILPLNKYRISGKEYMKFNKVARGIVEELKRAGFKNTDLLILDYFLYEVWCAGETKREESKRYEFDHDEIRDYVRDIGLFLGFEAETEKTIGHGARVDVIWRARIANLGVVTYVFEVHRGGSIDSLVLNLQKAVRNLTVQKIIAVSSGEQLEKIKKEINGLPEDFIRALSFWDAQDVEQTHGKLSEVIRSIKRLELVKSEFD